MSRPPDSLRRFTPLDHGPPLPPLDTFPDIIPHDVSPAPVPPPHQIRSSGRPLVPFDPHPFPSPPRPSRLSRLPRHQRRASYASGYSSHYSQSSSRSNSGSSLLGGRPRSAAARAEYTLRRPPDLPSRDFLAQHPHLVFRRTAALYRQRQAADCYHQDSSSSPPPPSERQLLRPGFATGSPQKHRRAAARGLRRPGLPSVVEAASSQERLERDEATATSDTAKMSQNSYGRRDLPEPPPPQHHSFRDAGPAGVASPSRGWYQGGPRIGPYGDARRPPDSHHVAATASPARQQARVGYDSRLPRRVPAAQGTATATATAAAPPPALQSPDVRRPPPRESFSQPRPQGRLQPSETGMSGIHPAFRRGPPLLTNDHPEPSVAVMAHARDEMDDRLSIAGPAFMRPAQHEEAHDYGDDDDNNEESQSCHRNTSSVTSTVEQEQQTAKRLRIRGPRDPSFKLRTKRSNLQEALPAPQQTDVPTRTNSTGTVSSAGATWHGSATESSTKSVLERSDSDKSSYHSFPDVVLAERDENNDSNSTPSNDQTPRATTTSSSAQDQTPTATALRRRPSCIPVPRRPSDQEGTPTPQPLSIPSSRAPPPVSTSTSASITSPSSLSSSPPAPATADKQQQQQQQQHKPPPSGPEEEPNWTLKTTSSSSSSQQSDAGSEPTWRPSRLHDTVSRTRAHYDQYVIRMYPTSSDSLAAAGAMSQQRGGANTAAATTSTTSAPSSSSPPPPPIPARAPNRPSSSAGRSSPVVIDSANDEATASSTVAAAAGSGETAAVNLTTHEQVELHNLRVTAADWARQSRSSCSVAGGGDEAEKEATEPDSEPDSSSCFGGLRRLWRKK